jgi:hypothetical protein
MEKGVAAGIGVGLGAGSTLAPGDCVEGCRVVEGCCARILANEASAHTINVKALFRNRLRLRLKTMTVRLLTHIS